MLDSAVSQAFKVSHRIHNPNKVNVCSAVTYIFFSLQVYIAKIDPTSSLGLSTDSIYSYSMGHIRRVLGGEAPETQPSRCISQGSTGITVALKGLWKGMLNVDPAKRQTALNSLNVSLTFAMDVAITLHRIRSPWFAQMHAQFINSAGC